MADAASVVVAEICRTGGELPLGHLDRLIRAIAGADRIYLHAVGRCGLVVRCFAVRLVQLGLQPQLVGDNATTAITPADGLVVASGSGETRSAVLIAEQAQALGVSVLAITAHGGSTLGRLADAPIVLPGVAKTDHVDAAASRQPPGSLFEQMLFCFLEEAVVRLAADRDPDFQTIRRRHANLE